MKPVVAAALWIGALAAGAPALAVQVRSHTAGPEDLQRGSLDGVAASARGRLSLAPALERLGSATMPGGAAHVWAMAAEPSGSVVLGTGPDGRIVRVGPGGAEKILFTVDDPMVTALTFAANGDLLAGTAPGGRIWRIRPDGRGDVWCETGERYVWSLAAAPDGTVYAGTGEEGVILRIDAKGQAAPLFDSGESHIVRVALAADGALLAGGGGRGLVYRIGRDGKASVLHDDDLPEIRDLLAEPDGGVLVAVVAPAAAEPRPPAVRIRVPDGAPPTPDALGGLEGAPADTLEGIIEGLPSAGPESRRGTRGRIVRIAKDGVVTELWRSATEAPFALAADPRGGALFGTGEPARLYRVDPSDDIALLASLAEGQLTGLARAAGRTVAATSNPAAAYRLSASPGSGSFVSRPIDAGGIARWGAVRWAGVPAGARVEVSTRTGNSADPDDTWSAWSAGLHDASGSQVASPEGRFLQWRLKLSGAQGGEPWVSDVSVAYAPRNRPPLVRDFRLDRPGLHTFSKEAAFRWTVVDPDGDPVDVQVQYRPAGGSAWQSAVRTTAADPGAAASSEPEEMRKEGRLVWDTTSVPEGSYEVRAMASDQPANHPGQGRATPSDRGLTVQVDRTPPDVAVERAADGSVEVRVQDGISPAGRVEVLEDGQVKYQAASVDGVDDSSHEVYRLPAAGTGPDRRVVRVTDAAGNTIERAVQGP